MLGFLEKVVATRALVSQLLQELAETAAAWNASFFSSAATVATRADTSAKIVVVAAGKRMVDGFVLLCWYYDSKYRYLV